MPSDDPGLSPFPTIDRSRDPEAQAWVPDLPRDGTPHSIGTISVETSQSGWTVCSLSPDGRFLATAHKDGSVHCWDLTTGLPLWQRPGGHSRPCWRIAWSPRGDRIASGGQDNSIRLWNAADGRVGPFFTSRRSTFGSDIKALAWAPDGARLAFAGGDAILFLWDPDAGRQPTQLTGHDKNIWSLSWSPDGRRLASAGSDTTIRLWDPERLVSGPRFTGHKKTVWSLSWSPDGRWLASGSEDGTVRLWDGKDEVPGQVLTGHEDSVEAVAWSPDGEWLASAGRDYTIRLWDSTGGHGILTFPDATALALSWSPDSAFLASAHHGDVLRFWDMGSWKKDPSSEIDHTHHQLYIDAITQARRKRLADEVQDALAFYIKAIEAARTVMVRNHSRFQSIIDEAMDLATDCITREQVASDPAGRKFDDNPLQALALLQNWYRRTQSPEAKEAAGRRLGPVARILHLHVCTTNLLTNPAERQILRVMAVCIAVSLLHDAKDYEPATMLAAAMLPDLDTIILPDAEPGKRILTALVEAAEAGLRCDRLQEGLAIARKAHAYQQDFPEVWDQAVTPLLRTQSGLLVRLGRIEEGLEIAQRAVDTAIDDQARLVAETHLAELNSQVFGNLPDYREVVAAALGEEGGLWADAFMTTLTALSEGRSYDPGTMGRLVTALTEKFQQVYPDASGPELLLFRAKDMLSRGDSAGATELILKLNAVSHIKGPLVRSSGSSDPIGVGISERESYDHKKLGQGADFRSPVLGIEAGLLMLGVQGLLDEKAAVSIDRFSALLARGRRELSGFEPFFLSHTVANVYLRWKGEPRAMATSTIAEWMEGVVDALRRHVDWGTPEAQLAQSRLVFGSLELVCFLALDAAENSLDQGLATRLNRAGILLFSMLQGLSLRLITLAKADARRRSVQPGAKERRLAADLTEQARTGGDAALFTVTRNALLTAGHAWRHQQGRLFDNDTRPDPERVPSLLWLQTNLIGTSPEGRDESGLITLDTLTGGYRFDLRFLDFDLNQMAEKVVDAEGFRLTPSALMRLGAALLPALPETLPPWIGIRTSGKLQTLPFAALITKDERFLGDMTVPVILNGVVSDVGILEDRFLTPDVLVVGDAVYQPDQPGQDLSDDWVLDPMGAGRARLDAAMAVLERMTMAGEAPRWPVDDSGEPGLAPLPGSRLEALAVHERSRRCRPALLGPAATPQGLSAALDGGTPDILHLAVHGVSDAETPDRSYLALSRDPGTGRPTALGFHEIVLMDLSGCRLVVLSACSTLVGRVHQAEGVLALAWAFRAAGADAVIATRWETSDVASVFYWRAFYRALADGRPLYAAMTDGQVALRTYPRFDDPWYWGTCQLVL